MTGAGGLLLEVLPFGGQERLDGAHRAGSAEARHLAKNTEDRRGHEALKR